MSIRMSRRLGRLNHSSQKVPQWVWGFLVPSHDPASPCLGFTVGMRVRSIATMHVSLHSTMTMLLRRQCMMAAACLPNARKVVVTAHAQSKAEQVCPEANCLRHNMAATARRAPAIASLSSMFASCKPATMYGNDGGQIICQNIIFETKSSFKTQSATSKFGPVACVCEMSQAGILPGSCGRYGPLKSVSAMSWSREFTPDECSHDLQGSTCACCCNTLAHQPSCERCLLFSARPCALAGSKAPECSKRLFDVLLTLIGRLHTAFQDRCMGSGPKAHLATRAAHSALLCPARIWSCTEMKWDFHTYHMTNQYQAKRYTTSKPAATEAGWTAAVLAFPKPAPAHHVPAFLLTI